MQPQVMDMNEWKACLVSPCPKGASSTHWLYWILECVLINITIGQIVLDPGSIVETYVESLPHIRGLVPIALMSAGLTVTISDRRKLFDWENLIRLLEILPGSDDGEVLPDWLMGTREWVLGEGERVNEHVGDLLTVFVEQMEKLAEQGMLNRDATYKRAINFVEELRERREVLGDFVIKTDDSIGFRRITR